MVKRMRSLAIRVVLATAVAWVLATVSWPVVPPQSWFAFVQVPIAVFLLICYIGKLLIDTFFFNHYQP